MRTLFLGLTLAAGATHVVSLILIMAALDRRGQRTGMFLARIHFYKYLAAYRETTRKETGKTGPLYLLWNLSIILALVFAAAAALSPKV